MKEKELFTRSKRNQSSTTSFRNFLDWDTQTGMPEKASEYRRVK